MHEYSIVQALINQVEDNVKLNNGSIATKIVIKVGVMSGIEVDLLKRAFDTFKEKTLCEKAELIINIQKIKVKCLSCFEINELNKNQYICPNCESCELEILDGEDSYLMSIEME